MTGIRLLPVSKSTVAEILHFLEQARIDCALSGGWAEELQGLREPAPQQDVDLVAFDVPFSYLDERLQGSKTDDVEITATNRFHGRTFLYKGVRVDIDVIMDSNGAPFTNYWGRTRLSWALPLLVENIRLFGGKNVKALSPENMRLFRVFMEEQRQAGAEMPDE
jgi:hypothetical protein